MKIKKVIATIACVFAVTMAMTVIASAEDEIQVPLSTEETVPVDGADETAVAQETPVEEVTTVELESPTEEEVPQLTAETSKGAPDNNPSTGVSLAAIPAVIAAGVAVASRKKK